MSEGNGNAKLDLERVMAALLAHLERDTLLLQKLGNGFVDADNLQLALLNSINSRLDDLNLRVAGIDHRIDGLIDTLKRQ